LESEARSECEPAPGILAAFLSRYPDNTDRVAALEAALKSASGKVWRGHIAQWITALMAIDSLVPDAYRTWRAPVRLAMQFVLARLSARRLAQKIVEQLELPPDTAPELRLLQLVSRMPGLQKMGQVLARNRHLQPRLRRALSQLENGISDVRAEEIRGILMKELAPQLGLYAVRIERAILREASVSAVVRFTWRNPRTRRRERGVFKVLKPHIPGCFAEDMKILQQLANYFARKRRGSGSHLAGLTETLTDIRLLLEHEVDFRREQATLTEASRLYGSIPGVRVPAVIEPLCTGRVTALSQERGIKITQVMRRSTVPRSEVAEKLAETVIAVPAFTRQAAIFHADPHAGNLLYDQHRRELVLLDWALAEPLTKELRRNLIVLVLMLILRDPEGISKAIADLRSRSRANQARLIRGHVNSFLDSLPLWQLPGPIDAMRLLDRMALDGVQFPAPLLMFRKASFTLDGVVHDIAGGEVRVDSVIARYARKHWLAAGAAFCSLLSATDLLALEWSALTFTTRLCLRAARRPWEWLAGAAA
jgi:ubiquinone biosynthesis protein